MWSKIFWLHKCWWKYIPILEDGIYYYTFQQFKCQSESDTGVESVGEFCGVHGDINNVPFGSQSLCFISTSSSSNCVGSDGSKLEVQMKLLDYGQHV